MRFQSTDWLAKFIYLAVNDDAAVEVVADTDSLVESIHSKLYAMSGNNNFGRRAFSGPRMTFTDMPNSGYGESMHITIGLNSNGDILTLLFGHYAVVSQGKAVPGNDDIIQKIAVSTPQAVYDRLLSINDKFLGPWYMETINTWRNL